MRTNMRPQFLRMPGRGELPIWNSMQSRPDGDDGHILCELHPSRMIRGLQPRCVEDPVEWGFSGSSGSKIPECGEAELVLDAQAYQSSRCETA